ncbi:MAG: RNA methyltransferase [Gemmatimonadales bacterium]
MRPLSAPVVVLVEPQDLVNIASVVRIAKNFELAQVRLVRPRVFDAYRIEGIAHNTAEVIEAIGHYGSLDAALADCVYAVALTARGRTHKRSVQRPRQAAAELVARVEGGPVAFVAGRETNGLTNDELDRCHALVTIPTNPEHSSLNLAQAVAVLAYEVMVARGGEALALKGPRRTSDNAPADLLERMFADWEGALEAIEFFKTRQPGAVMRSFREILYRADLDHREAALVRAMGIEVVRFFERKGIVRGKDSTGGEE